MGVGVHPLGLGEQEGEEQQPLQDQKGVGELLPHPLQEDREEEEWLLHLQ